jgi:hypothetical protein
VRRERKLMRNRLIELIQESVDGCAQSGKFRRDISSRHVEKLMLQIMGNTGGCLEGLAVYGIVCVDGAVIRDKVGQLLGETGTGHQNDVQTVGKDFPDDFFV